MQLHNNFFIHAVAGSGKTTQIIKLALRFRNSKILITTYTTKNTDEIRKKIISLNGYIPSNVEIKTWFGFLLSDCVRPYQKYLGFNERISDLYFTVQNPHNKKLPNGKTIKISKREDGVKYYVNKQGQIYSCMLSDFAYHCNEKANNAIIKRIEKCYDYIFIDEAQDLSGWDFSFIDLLLSSTSKIVVVGDKRQNLFDTHKSNKNNKYAENLYLYFSDKQKEHKGILKVMNSCHRCNQIICDFADKLHPELENTISKNSVKTFHDGIFYVKESQLEKYINKLSPQILVWAKGNKLCKTYKTLNFGESKGLTFERVLISPTSEIYKYLEKGILTKNSLVIRNKLYVGITRAKYSVAFIIKDNDDISKFAFNEIVLWENNL